MATLPSKNALNDLTGGYYSYWTDGTTEGRATVAVLLGSTDAQAAAASFSSLALGTPLSAANGGTGLTSISTLLNSNVTPATLGLVIGTNVQEYSVNLDALAADPLTASTAASTYLTQASAASTYLTQATAASTYLTIATAASTYQPLDSDLTAIAGLSSADGNFIVGSATGWVAESGATARTSLGLGNVENTALSTWAGSTSITTIGTITTGTVPAARVSAGTFQSGAFVFGGALSGITTLAVTTSATIASDLTLASGSITSASGAISFGNENLSTSGTVTVSTSTTDATLSVVGGSTYGAIINMNTTANSWELVSFGTGSASSGRWSIRDGGSQRYTIDASGNHNFQAGSITTTGTFASGSATVTGTLGVTGKITGAASTTAAATINLPAGTAPTSPAESDMWFVGDVMYRRIGGVTKSVTFT